MTKNIILIASATVIVLLVGILAKEEPTKVRLFCANQRIFIEFEEKRNTWGTMWLDDYGLPVQCDTPRVSKNTGNII